MRKFPVRLWILSMFLLLVGVFYIKDAHAKSIDPHAQCGDIHFTEEQSYILRTAYAYGSQPNEYLNNKFGSHVGHTLAAIVWRESFVGRHVVRYNTKDGDYGSWGVGHVQFTTYLHMKGYENVYAVRNDTIYDYIERMLNDDYFAIKVAYDYIVQDLARRTSSFHEMRKAYNGSGERAERYAVDISNRVNYLIECGV